MLQGLGIIVLGVAAIVAAAFVSLTNQHAGDLATSKEPAIAAIGVLAIVGGVLRMLGKIGN
ncbi:hypothetical protein [Amnibacterium kyonggiense]